MLQRVAIGDAAAKRSRRQADDAWTAHRAARRDASRRRNSLETPSRELLARLFGEDDIRLFEGTPVFFQCSCSRERVAGILQSLGDEELQSLLKERGDVEVRCEFCNRAWRFDAVDVAGLFSRGRAQQAPPAACH